MGLKICLIDPPVSSEELIGGTRSMELVVNVIPALGLAYLAGLLEEEGYEVKIMDCSVGISHSRLSRLLIKLKY